MFFKKYWNNTRSPLYSFLFTVPLFFIYEVGILLSSSTALISMRNGADALMRQILSALGFNGFYWMGAIFFIGFLGFSQNKKAVITFDKTVIDYGTIDKGANGVRDFVFTNTGDAPLIISNVKSTCGCTIPKKPEKPILPGESDKIQVKYDTKRVGFIRKSISVTSNASNPNVILKITGQVIADNKKTGLEKKKKSIVEDY